MNKQRYQNLTEEQKREKAIKDAEWIARNKQRVIDVKRRHLEANRDKYLEASRRYYQKNKEIFAEKRKLKADKIRAQRAVNTAIRDGLLVRKPWIICGNDKVEAHHSSYAQDKHLCVEWFCNRHHKAWHRVFIAE